MALHIIYYFVTLSHISRGVGGLSFFPFPSLAFYGALSARIMANHFLFFLRSHEGFHLSCEAPDPSGHSRARNLFFQMSKCHPGSLIFFLFSLHTPITPPSLSSFLLPTSPRHSAVQKPARAIRAQSPLGSVQAGVRSFIVDALGPQLTCCVVRGPSTTRVDLVYRRGFVLSPSPFSHFLFSRVAQRHLGTCRMGFSRDLARAEFR